MQKPKIPKTADLGRLNRPLLATALKFATVAAVVFALYAQDLIMVFKGAVTTEATYHILARLPLFAYLVFKKKENGLRHRSRKSCRRQLIPKKLQFICWNIFVLNRHTCILVWKLQFHATGVSYVDAAFDGCRAYPLIV